MIIIFVIIRDFIIRFLIIRAVVILMDIVLQNVQIVTICHISGSAYDCLGDILSGLV